MLFRYIKRVRKYLGDEDFCLTYGDGLADIDLPKLLEFHKAHGGLATLTAAQPPGRFGALGLNGNLIESFKEKPMGDGNWINGGFFVLNPKVIDLISDDTTVWEKEPLEKLAEAKQLHAFKHSGFWQPMATLRDKNHLEDLWQKNKAHWKKW